MKPFRTACLSPVSGHRVVCDGTEWTATGRLHSSPLAIVSAPLQDRALCSRVGRVGAVAGGHAAAAAAPQVGAGGCRLCHRRVRARDGPGHRVQPSGAARLGVARGDGAVGTGSTVWERHPCQCKLEVGLSLRCCQSLLPIWSFVIILLSPSSQHITCRSSSLSSVSVQHLEFTPSP